jgi:hypothetical protein
MTSFGTKILVLGNNIYLNTSNLIEATVFASETNSFHFRTNNYYNFRISMSLICLSRQGQQPYSVFPEDKCRDIFDFWFACPLLSTFEQDATT